MTIISYNHSSEDNTFPTLFFWGFCDSICFFVFPPRYPLVENPTVTSLMPPLVAPKFETFPLVVAVGTLCVTRCIALIPPLLSFSLVQSASDADHFYDPPFVPFFLCPPRNVSSDSLIFFPLSSKFLWCSLRPS